MTGSRLLIRNKRQRALSDALRRFVEAPASGGSGPPRWEGLIVPSSLAISQRMSKLARRNTEPEIALRRELHRRGLRYRVQVPVPENRRRTIDIVFPRAKMAVFVDGCFWHGCPEHGNAPAVNTAYWSKKIA